MKCYEIETQEQGHNIFSAFRGLKYNSTFLKDLILQGRTLIFFCYACTGNYLSYAKENGQVCLLS